MPKTTSFDESHSIQCKGPALQDVVPASVHGLGSSVPASGNILSNLIMADGYPTIAVGIQSTQAGSVQVQRYLDDAGTIVQGAPVSQSLTANTPANLNVTDGLPFSSFTVKVANSSGSTATISNFIIMLQA